MSILVSHILRRASESIDDLRFKTRASHFVSTQTNSISWLMHDGNPRSQSDYRNNVYLVEFTAT